MYASGLDEQAEGGVRLGQMEKQQHQFLITRSIFVPSSQTLGTEWILGSIHCRLARTFALAGMKSAVRTNEIGKW